MPKYRPELKPEIGMGCTIQVGSDRYPATIVRIVTPITIEIQEDLFRRADNNGQSEDQTWIYKLNPSAPTIRVRQRKSGDWRTQQTETYRSKNYVFIGERDAYQDPSF